MQLWRSLHKQDRLWYVGLIPRGSGLEPSFSSLSQSPSPSSSQASLVLDASEGTAGLLLIAGWRAASCFTAGSALWQKEWYAMQSSGCDSQCSSTSQGGEHFVCTKLSSFWQWLPEAKSMSTKQAWKIFGTGSKVLSWNVITYIYELSWDFAHGIWNIWIQMGILDMTSAESFWRNTGRLWSIVFGFSRRLRFEQAKPIKIAWLGLFGCSSLNSIACSRPPYA